jgi:hypothetical protein
MSAHPPQIRHVRLELDPASARTRVESDPVFEEDADAASELIRLFALESRNLEND